MDQQRLYTDLDLIFHFDAETDPDPDPTVSGTHVGKAEVLILLFTAVLGNIVLSFL